MAILSTMICDGKVRECTADRNIFVGRESEQRVFRASIEAVLAGRSRLLLLSGPAGMGKTRAAEEVARLARAHGMTVLWGRCYEEEGAPPFWPWAQILRGGFAAIGVEPTSLSARIADVVQLLPEIRSDRGSALDSAPARFRVFDAVAAFLAQVAARSPVLLILDDLHGADPSSLRLLDFVARHASVPLLLLGCFRDGLAPSHPLTATVAEALRLPEAQQLTLAGLTPSEVSRFIELAIDTKPEPIHVVAIHERTEGNPLFVQEYVRLLQAQWLRSGAIEPDMARALPVPEGIHAVVARRVAPLSASCQRVLAAAAAIGREFLGDVLVRISAPENVDSAIEEARRAGLLIAGLRPGTHRFSHATFRDALYDRLDAAQRAELHRRIGAAFAARADRDEHLSELARHSILASRGKGDLAQAVEYARSAGRRALGVLAYEEAVRLLELALGALKEIGPEADRDRCAILVDLGIALRASGDKEASKASLLRAAAIARRIDLPDELVRAALHYGTKLPWGEGPFPDPVQCELVETALSVCAGSGTIQEAALLARLATSLRYSPEPERREAAGERALTLARQHDDDAVLLTALNAAHLTRYRPGSCEERLEIVREMVELAERSGDLDMLFQAHLWRFDDCMEVGDRAAVDSSLAARERLAAELREPYCLWTDTVVRGALLCLEGAFEEAERTMGAALEIGRSTNFGADIIYEIQIAHLHLERGSRDGLVASERRMSMYADAVTTMPVFAAVAANILAALGETDEARSRYVVLAANTFAALPDDQNWLIGIAHLASSCATLEDRAGAEILYSRMLPYESRVVTSVGHNATLGPIALHLGKLSALLGRHDQAAAHFDRALAISQRMRARPWRARTRHAYACMLMARREPADLDRARTLLDDARRTAESLQMPVLLERIAAAVAELPPQLARPATAPTKASRGSVRVTLAALGAVFRDEGQFWACDYGGRSVTLKNTKGLRYLLYLLQHPNWEILALDLAVQVSNGAADTTGALDRERLASMTSRSDVGFGAILDPTAKAAYRKRVEELRSEITEAERFSDVGRMEKAREEMEYIGDQLRAATGIGGRDRPHGSLAERARLTVTKGVRSALQMLAELDPELGHYLTACIKTGTYCSYTPPPARG
jgi:tetratricopeptide (TPR) repeat protein